MHDYDDKSRLIAKLLRDIIREQSFDTLADLADVLKTRCAKLKIQYSPQALSEALAVVASNHSLVVDPFAGLQKHDTRREVFVESLDPPRDQAERLHREFLERFHKERAMESALAQRAK